MTTTTIQQKLDQRYGRRRSTRRRVIGWSIVGVVALSLIAGLGWSTVAGALDDVDVDETGFAVVDEHVVSVSFQVTVPPNRSFACVLEAQDEQHGIVGWRVVEYPADEAHERAISEEIRTLSLATTGFVNSCWVT